MSKPEIPPDLETFVLHEHIVTTINDEKISVPRCSWGSEERIFEILKDIIKSIVDSGLLNGDQTVAQATGFMLSSIFETAPAKLEQATCILMKKDREWVRENLESEEMIKLVLPFLYSKRQSIGKALGPYLSQLGGLMQMYQS